MKVMRVLCDVPECTSENAERLRIFKDREADGAGSMENWYYVFDLCHKHTLYLLRDILEDVNNHVSSVSDKRMLEIVDKYKIKPRVE